MLVGRVLGLGLGKELVEWGRGSVLAGVGVGVGVGVVQPSLVPAPRHPIARALHGTARSKAGQMNCLGLGENALFRDF